MSEKRDGLVSERYQDCFDMNQAKISISVEQQDHFKGHLPHETK